LAGIVPLALVVLPTDGHRDDAVAQLCNRLLAARPAANFLQRAGF
jgi:hypothetical protein